METIDDLEESKRKVTEVKIFSVPTNLKEIKENACLNTNTHSRISSEEIFNKAFKLHSEGKISEATKYYQFLLDKDVTDPRVCSNYAEILQSLGEFKQAEILLRKAIKLKPDFFEAYSNLGNILKDLGRLEEAEISTRKAIELKSDFVEAHYTLAKILKCLGKLEQAETSLKQTIRLQVGNLKAYNELASIQEELGKSLEAKDSNKKILYLKSNKNLNVNTHKIDQNKLFREPSPIEYPIFYRPGMGTENVGGFLRSMVMMLRPKVVLEIGAGYTTPFLLEGLINNERVFDDGNLNESYFENYFYDAKLVIIDNESLGELKKVEGMEEIINSQYTDFVEGDFKGKAKELYKKYGNFDFIWFDCGGPNEYITFIKEYWGYCSDYIFFHFTYSNGKPNINHKIIHEHIKGNPVIFDIVEPHKKRQGSITVVKKERT